MEVRSFDTSAAPASTCAINTDLLFVAIFKFEGVTAIMIHEKDFAFAIGPDSNHIPYSIVVFEQVKASSNGWATALIAALQRCSKCNGCQSKEIGAFHFQVLQGFENLSSNRQRTVVSSV